MPYRTVKLAKENSVATLTLNRPEVHNAMNNEMNQELKTALEEIKSDSTIRVLIVTGAGDKAFSAGRDLKEYSGSKTTPIEVWAGRIGARGIDSVAGMPVPAIAAINGYAIGGGLELALACDIRIASENATFALMEIRRGFFPGGGATWRLAPLVGKGWAMEMILSGEPIDARTAERIGLVNRVVPPGELMKTARALAEKIAGWSPAAVQLAKQAVNQAGAAQEASGFNIGVALRALAETNEDRIAATRAFVEKDRPRNP
jgi:enoyl-CoA hydratase